MYIKRFYVTNALRYLLMLVENSKTLFYLPINTQYLILFSALLLVMPSAFSAIPPGRVDRIFSKIFMYVQIIAA